MAKAKAKADISHITVDYVLSNIKPKPYEMETARSYINQWLNTTKVDALDGRYDGYDPTNEAQMEDLIMGMFENAYNDGDMSPDGEPPAEDDSDDQEIVNVSQEAVKKALKVLLTNQNEVVAQLYEKHDEYNQEFFDGKLSLPVITIEKMNNRTLGNYTYAGHTLKLENHIKFNVNFVALNTTERVLETLRHEMIHQWQDQVLYAPKGEEPHNGQKKRPREWHNKDFKDMAAKVGIPANGSKCTGNPANMPEPKSYNRKFHCQCIASNDHFVTIWSTRKIDATCNVCGEPYEEVKKIDPKAQVIPVTQSHVERAGEDAVAMAMKERFQHFKRFEDDGFRDAFIDSLTEDYGDEHVSAMEKGVYQKNHNSYKEGYRYWIAYNTNEIIPDTIHFVEDDTHVEAPKVVEPQAIPPAKDKVARKKIAPKSQTSEVEAPAQRVWDINNKQDLLDAYNEQGNTRKAAELFTVHQTTFIRRAAKLGIDFNNL